MIKIVKAESSHASDIANFQVAMAMETEDFQLDAETVSQGVKHVFSHPEIGHYYVFLHNDTVCGSALTLYEWSDWRNGNVIWIHSVYVKPDSRKLGLYKAFYEAMKERVRADQSLKGLRLYVDKTNQRAIQVYQKLGMQDEHYSLFEWLESN